MRALRPHVEELVDQLLDQLEASSPPVDLHETLSFPLSVLVICELLGVPYEDRSQFGKWSRDVSDMHDCARAGAALQSLTRYMHALVARERAEPEDDVLSGVCAADAGALSDDEIARLGAFLLFGGHETTVNRIDLGTLLFITHPRQRQLLADSPSLLERA